MLTWNSSCQLILVDDTNKKWTFCSIHMKVLLHSIHSILTIQNTLLQKAWRCFIVLKFCSNFHIEVTFRIECSEWLRYFLCAIKRNSYFVNYVNQFRMCSFLFEYLGVLDVHVLFVLTWISTQPKIKIGSHVFTFAR